MLVAVFVAAEPYLVLALPVAGGVGAGMFTAMHFGGLTAGLRVRLLGCCAGLAVMAIIAVVIILV